VAVAEAGISVFLVDDEPGFRELVVTLLSREHGFSVQAADLDRWVEDIREQCTDVALIDLGLSGDGDALEAIPKLVASCPTTMVAALTGRPAEEEERSTLAAGAFVFYEKDVVDRLAELLMHDLALFRRALAGEDVIAPSALTRRVPDRAAVSSIAHGSGH
jgi:DNA-binding NarL/FixJ family response regulator